MHVFLYKPLCGNIQGNGRLKVYDMESKCFESDIKITESKHGRSVRLVSSLSNTLEKNVHQFF